MKVGINARFLVHPHTGIGQYTAHLIRALAEAPQSHEYFLFTPELVELNLPDHFHQIRVPEKDFRSASFRKAHWEHVLVPQEMQKWNVDLAHFLYPSNPWKKLSVPTVVTVHDAIPWRLPAYRQRLRSKLYHFYVKQALKKADHLITVSQFSKKEVQEIITVKDKKISVVYLAPPPPSTQPRLPDLSLRRRFLLYVGGYDERKNVPLLIRAYLKHIANHNALDLILVNGKNRGLEAYITNEFSERVAGGIPLRPKGKVVFTSSLTDAELEALYKQAVMLVHTSVYEGFNLPLVEAMSHGLPIICSDIEVNHEITDDAALFIDPHSLDSIGIGIHQLLHDRALRQELSQLGKEKVLDYSWKKHAEETLYVYNLFA